jgi:hypothetical protein
MKARMLTLLTFAAVPLSAQARPIGRHKLNLHNTFPCQMFWILVARVGSNKV